VSDHRPEPVQQRTSPGRPVRAVGPRLRILFHVLLVLLALIAANSVYLASITLLNFLYHQDGLSFENWFYFVMFLGHGSLGLMVIVVLPVFALIHLRNTWRRRSRNVARVGFILLAACLLMLMTGVLLLRVEGFFEVRNPAFRRLIYWTHVGSPLFAVWLYWLHRVAGPPVRWRLAAGFATGAAATVALMVVFHSQDPRRWGAEGPESGTQYFRPSLARTASGNFIPADVLMDDDYCRQCHADVHDDWSDSVHRFASFNNPVYLASVHETRQVALARDGNVTASRFCAGCHDPVPFFSGAFDDPHFDLLGHPTAQAGITCVACHSITSINSTRGNADFTIEQPVHYPFARSRSAALRWISDQLIKAKPEFHKRTFLKPFHSTAEFCSVCHKVHLPYELNHYREFLRGQNHYDSYLLSGVSGHGARSFYYPEVAEQNCNGCHMPRKPSTDFGAQVYAGDAQASIHDHLFPSANTGIAWLRDQPQVVQRHQDFLQGIVRVDLFGLREQGQIDGPLIAPLRPDVPVLQSGRTYLLETVIRTLKMGHHFTQGTTDSNEIWLEVTVTSGSRVIGRSGALDPRRGNEVDPWAHFVNVFMLDREGNRIDRRNAQDIFTPLYNHEIPPGAAQTVHYALDLPENLDAPVTVSVRLQYRKFDQRFMDFVARVNADLGNPIRGYQPGQPYTNDLPITTLAEDRITFAIAGSGDVAEQPVPDIPVWQRWNDYGIGLLLRGRAKLRQAEEAFLSVQRQGRYDGPLNLARVYEREGRLDEAVDALNRAARYQDDPRFPHWTWNWLSGLVSRQQGFLETAAEHLRNVLEVRTESMVQRHLDFSLDYEVLNLYGETLFLLGQQRQRQERPDEARDYWRQAADVFHRTLAIDSENVAAHYNLQLLYERLGDQQRADEHRRLHQRYKPDDNARDRAVRLAREKYPAANHASSDVVIYRLKPPSTEEPSSPPDPSSAEVRPAEEP
jgi:tetratricopeptide (TPR) repeat protein